MQSCDELSSLQSKLQLVLTRAQSGLTGDGRARLQKVAQSLTGNLLVLMDKAVVVIPTDFA